jgi:hypothetical protein
MSSAPSVHAKKTIATSAFLRDFALSAVNTPFVTLDFQAISCVSFSFTKKRARKQAGTVWMLDSYEN